MIPLFLSTDEVARLLGVDRSTLEYQRERGRVPGSLGVRIGKRYRYPVAAVIDYLASVGIDPDAAGRAIADLK